MSVRTWLAGMALGGLASWPSDSAGKTAVGLADATMAALNATPAEE